MFADQRLTLIDTINYDIILPKILNLDLIKYVVG